MELETFALFADGFAVIARPSTDAEAQITAPDLRSQPQEAMVK